MSYSHAISDSHAQFQSGKITLDEFRKFLDDVDYTDRSMREGENGFPTYFADLADARYMRHG